MCLLFNSGTLRRFTFWQRNLLGSPMTDAASTENSPKPPGGLPKIEFVVLIASMMALNALAIDIMVPALDDIGASFQLANENDQQLVMFAYVLGFGMPQLIWGPVSDHYGRRALLVISLVGYGAFGLACVFSKSFSALLIARFLMGVFSSAGRVVAVSVVRDVYEGRGMAQIMSFVMMVFMTVPILAPAIGQVILSFGPWPWIFYVLVIYAVVIALWSVARLPETLPAERRKTLSFVSAFGAYKIVLKTRVACGYVLASGILFGGLFAFIFTIEQVMREVFDREAQIGFWFAMVSIGLAASNFLNAVLVKRVGMRRLSHVAVTVFVVMSLINLGAMLTYGPVFAVFMPLMMLTFGTIGMIGSNFNAIAMEPLGEIAGTASAALGFATTTLAGGLGYLISSQFDGTVLPLLTGFAGLGIVSLAVLFITEKGRLFGTG
jgi:DHA1 family bicyclomycin/chloramphenicol resistance-like MFS transporter